MKSSSLIEFEQRSGSSALDFRHDLYRSTTPLLIRSIPCTQNPSTVPNQPESKTKIKYQHFGTVNNFITAIVVQWLVPRIVVAETLVRFQAMALFLFFLLQYLHQNDSIP
jgi:hypothetical protein